MTAANEQLQQEITERQHAEDELEQYCGRIEQRIEEQSIELATVNNKFQRQTAECQRLEQCLVQLQTKLDNVNSIISKQLELKEARLKVAQSSTLAPVSPVFTNN